MIMRPTVKVAPPHTRVLFVPAPETPDAVAAVNNDRVDVEELKTKIDIALGKLIAMYRASGWETVLYPPPIKFQIDRLAAARSALRFGDAKRAEELYKLAGALPHGRQANDGMPTLTV